MIITCKQTDLNFISSKTFPCNFYISGRSVFNIVRLLSKEFLLLVGVAILIAWPIVYFSMKEWLSNYPYRIDLDWVSFVLSGLAVVVIALVTLGYHTIKSATANPVDALTCE